ncbi:MAG TPA: hypothetical protein VJU16_00390 [Planctomycetota bacterium]|nr:hypothetical protein [Planctomycetota bacterium]
MLGPSFMFTSMPLGLIYSTRAVGRAPDRGFAWGGFVIALAYSAFMVIAAIVELSSK